MIVPIAGSSLNVESFGVMSVCYTQRCCVLSGMVFAIPICSGCVYDRATQLDADCVDGAAVEDAGGADRGCH